MTLQAGEVMFSLCLLSGLAPLPSPLTWRDGVGGGGQASPLPHLPHCQRENQLRLQAASAPLPLCLGKGSRLGAASWFGVGARIKTVPLFCQIPKGAGLRELQGEGRSRAARAPPGFLWGGGHRWLPSDFQLGTLGKFLHPCGSQKGMFVWGPASSHDLGLLLGAGQRLEETLAP